MSSYRFRILATILLTALAISALAGAIPGEIRSSLLGALRPHASANNVRKRSLRPNANATQSFDEPKVKEREQFTLYRNDEGELPRLQI